MREFRAAWIATVDNIDWPSKRTLSPENERRELASMFDTAAGMHLNAVILQIRPSADALYPSRIEPWSEYLTGRQGRAPSPPWDPLQFAVEEAHRRGLQLHCWINPYRANHPSQKGPLAANHIGKRRPDLVHKYGSFLWMDPGETEVQRQTLAVVRDVVRRYDIDGVHIDDYFYPYKEKDLDFPDAAAYGKYRSGGGTLDRGDWRRQNVDEFVHDLYTTIKEEKRWVQLGISPFGIYRPGYPAGIKAGVDQYADLYADARKWLVEGWCDYFTPQLYWPIAQKAQSYPVLLDWWRSQNPLKRNIWPGNFTSRTDPSEGNWKPKEVIDQIMVTRKQGANGNVHFSMKAFTKNYNGITDALRGGPYSAPAIPPASPWLDNTPPESPEVQVDEGLISWKPQGDEAAMWWVVQRRYRDKWVTELLGAPKRELQTTALLQTGERMDEVAVTAVDRLGNASNPSFWRR
ncbi:glycoside hydrolase family 10 protein [soil metagenome]